MKPNSTIKLSDIAEINPPRHQLRLNDDDLVTFIPMSDVTDSARWVNRQSRVLREVRHGYTVFRDGDVLFAKITPCMENGKGCLVEGLVNGVGYGSTEFHVLRARPNGHPGFIFQWTTAPELRLKAAAHMTGSAGQQRVPATFLEQFQIPHVTYEEQAAIAEILTTVDRAIEQTEALIAKQRRIKAGLLHDLLTRGIDEQGKLRDPATHRFKESPVGLVPEEWEVSTVGAAFDTATGFTLGAHRRPKQNRRKYLRVANVQREHLLLDDIAELEAQEHELQGRLLEENDFLIVEGHASPEEIGRCARVTKEAVGLTFQNHLFRLRSKLFVPRFALAWLNGAWVRNYWRLHCGTSSGLNTINQTMLGALPIPIPPGCEQKAMAIMLDAADMILSSSLNQCEKLVKLKMGLMQDLLTGQVPVSSLAKTTSLSDYAA